MFAGRRHLLDFSWKSLQSLSFIIDTSEQYFQVACPAWIALWPMDMATAADHDHKYTEAVFSLSYNN